MGKLSKEAAMRTIISSLAPQELGQRGRTLLALASLGGLLIAGCGVGAGDLNPNPAASNLGLEGQEDRRDGDGSSEMRSAVPAAVEDVVVDTRSSAQMQQPQLSQRTPRARGTYHPITPSQSIALMEQGAQARLPGGPPMIVFMQRNGGTYYGGNNDSSQNRSSIVPGQSATVGPFHLGDAAWEEVMDCTTEMFSRFNVQVTDVEPQSGAYIESVVGGHPSQLGLPNGVGGVAPIDPYQCNLIERAIVYTFTQNLGNNTRVICEVVAQEVAHAMSLDHQYLCSDPMTYLNGCGAKTFQDQASQCGEYSPRQCNCGRPSQNSVQVLLEKLGPSDGSPPPPPPPPDDEDPTVSIVSPSDGATLPANTQIEVVATADDNNALAAVELEWDFSGSTFGCPASGGGWSCAVNGNTRTWTLNVSTGSRTFRVKARDLSGNQVTTQERTIDLGETAEPGTPAPEAEPDGTPDDDTPPDAHILSPSDGATLPAYETVTVSATVSDDVDVAGVNLEWDFSGDRFPCPYQSQAVQCVQDGSTSTWTISVGIGDRTFRVNAEDAAGNTFTTPSRTITLSQTAIPPPPEDDEAEDDDTFETGAPLSCGSSVDQRIVSGDDDWFFIETTAGVQVTATVDSDADVSLRASTGAHSSTEIATSNSGELVFVAPGDVGLRLRSDDTGDYRLSVVCVAPPGGGEPGTPSPEGEPSASPEGEPSASPEGEPDFTTIEPESEPSTAPDIPRTPGVKSDCSQAGGTTPLFALVLLGLVGLRRRRRR